MSFFIGQKKVTRKFRRTLNLSNEEYWELYTLLSNLNDEDEVYYGNGLSDNPALLKILDKLIFMEAK